MANVIDGFELALYRLMLSSLTVIAAIGFETQCHPHRRVLHAAENQALKGYEYVTKTVHSRVICGRECSMDERCKSFNFFDCNYMCELNNATREEHSEYFTTTQGSVYFDADEGTPLFSLADSLLNRHVSCKMLLDAGYRSSSFYTIYPVGSRHECLQVFGDMETDGGGWIVFQRRQDGSVDFYRDWGEYKSGFGDLSGEFWLGNDNLVDLTSDDSRGTWELRVDLGDWDDTTAWAKYNNFRIWEDKYTLIFGTYDIDSTAGNSLNKYNGKPFSTKDNDNDENGQANCAQVREGAWWFKDCAYSHLNGKYYQNGEHQGDTRGIRWHHWKRNTSLQNCSMKIRETYI